ncbi:MAG: cyclic nucleotide-binding domain-containing protein [Thermodesulfobacteriota bacterium]
MASNAKFITKNFTAGETLFKQGDKGDFIYIIISGVVRICRKVNGRLEQLALLSSGDILGEMAILTNEPRCASAVASEPTQVIMVNDRTLRLALLNNDLPILKPLTSQLILRFKEAEQQANYYRRKSSVLRKEVAELKEKLLQHELASDNG